MALSLDFSSILKITELIGSIVSKWSTESVSADFSTYLWFVSLAYQGETAVSEQQAPQCQSSCESQSTGAYARVPKHTQTHTSWKVFNTSTIPVLNSSMDKSISYFPHV